MTVYRSIGTPRLRHLDPFLLLDHFGSDDPNDYIAGFPDHPHRGFITLTYMLDGRMLHRDSLGNTSELRAGGAQWMRAGSGVIHSEMPQQAEGRMRGFQLWINLPAAQKMSEPAYQEFSAQAIPELASPGHRVRILLGEYAGVRGPIADDVTQVQYLDVALERNARFEHALPAAHTAFIYVFEGEAVAGNVLKPHTLGVLSPGEDVQVTAGVAGTRFILVAGRPLYEPVVQYGPFVMNTREEIEQALRDYRAGTLVRHAPDFSAR
ncbi:pirin family protein [Thiobacter sp. AK1]|uniref:Pirin family protein n=1 Tax=Thiobacter aerophilum TaxID=3121275 RepID=A0ABV0EE21_9BURK